MTSVRSNTPSPLVSSPISKVFPPVVQPVLDNTRIKVDIPSSPSSPFSPAAPGAPSCPSAPSTPGVPSCPSAPSAPGAPSAPWMAITFHPDVLQTWNWLSDST